MSVAYLDFSALPPLPPPPPLGASWPLDDDAAEADILASLAFGLEKS